MRATRPVLIDLSPQWLMATREILNLTLGTFPSTAESGGLLQLNTATGAFSANAIEHHDV